MTTTPHILTGRATPELDRAAIEVRWSAMLAAPAGGAHGGGRRGRESSFVLTVQPVDARHAIVECLVETSAGTREIVRRRPVPCAMTHDGPLVHLDAHFDHRRGFALTCETGARGGADCRLLYARCTILAEAGFTPGGFDPPTASLRWPEADAVAG